MAAGEPFLVEIVMVSTTSQSQVHRDEVLETLRSLPFLERTNPNQIYWAEVPEADRPVAEGATQWGGIVVDFRVPEIDPNDSVLTRVSPAGIELKICLLRRSANNAALRLVFGALQAEEWVRRQGITEGEVRDEILRDASRVIRGIGVRQYNDFVQKQNIIDQIFQRVNDIKPFLLPIMDCLLNQKGVAWIDLLRSWIDDPEVLLRGKIELVSAFAGCWVSATNSLKVIGQMYRSTTNRETLRLHATGLADRLQAVIIKNKQLSTFWQQLAETSNAATGVEALASIAVVTANAIRESSQLHEYLLRMIKETTEMKEFADAMSREAKVQMGKTGLMILGRFAFAGASLYFNPGEAATQAQKCFFILTCGHSLPSSVEQIFSAIEFFTNCAALVQFQGDSTTFTEFLELLRGTIVERVNDYINHLQTVAEALRTTEVRVLRSLASQFYVSDLKLHRRQLKESLRLVHQFKK